MEFLEKLLQEFFHDKILQELFSEFFQKLLQGFLQKFYFRCSSDALHVSGENPLGGASKSLCHKLLQQYLRKLLQQFFGKFIQNIIRKFLAIFPKISSGIPPCFPFLQEFRHSCIWNHFWFFFPNFFRNFYKFA